MAAPSPAPAAAVAKEAALSPAPASAAPPATTSTSIRPSADFDLAQFDVNGDGTLEAGTELEAARTAFKSASQARKNAQAAAIERQNEETRIRREFMREAADSGVSADEQRFTKKQAAYRRSLADKSKQWADEERKRMAEENRAYKARLKAAGPKVDDKGSKEAWAPIAARKEVEAEAATLLTSIRDKVQDFISSLGGPIVVSETSKASEVDPSIVMHMDEAARKALEAKVEAVNDKLGNGLNQLRLQSKAFTKEDPIWAPAHTNMAGGVPVNGKTVETCYLAGGRYDGKAAAKRPKSPAKKQLRSS